MEFFKTLIIFLAGFFFNQAALATDVELPRAAAATTSYPGEVAAGRSLQAEDVNGVAKLLHAAAAAASYLEEETAGRSLQADAIDVCLEDIGILGSNMTAARDALKSCQYDLDQRTMTATLDFNTCTHDNGFEADCTEADGKMVYHNFQIQCSSQNGESIWFMLTGMPDCIPVSCDILDMENYSSLMEEDYIRGIESEALPGFDCTDGTGGTGTSGGDSGSDADSRNGSTTLSILLMGLGGALLSIA